MASPMMPCLCVCVCVGAGRGHITLVEAKGVELRFDDRRRGSVSASHSIPEVKPMLPHTVLSVLPTTTPQRTQGNVALEPRPAVTPMMTSPPRPAPKPRIQSNVPCGSFKYSNYPKPDMQIEKAAFEYSSGYAKQGGPGCHMVIGRGGHLNYSNNLRHVPRFNFK